IAGFSLVAIAALAGPASADPIKLTAGYFQGPQGVPFTATATGIDPTRLYVSSIGAEHLTRETKDFGPPIGIDYAKQTISLDSPFHFELGVADPSKPQPFFVGPWLDIGGQITGS